MSEILYNKSSKRLFHAAMVVGGLFMSNYYNWLGFQLVYPHRGFVGKQEGQRHLVIRSNLFSQPDLLGRWVSI